jgi:hypothetical protein
MLLNFQDIKQKRIGRAAKNAAESNAIALNCQVYGNPQWFQDAVNDLATIGWGCSSCGADDECDTDSDYKSGT